MSQLGALAGDDPFDPPGVSWTAVSPKLALARRAAACGFGLVVSLGVWLLAEPTGVGWLRWVAAVLLLDVPWSWWLIGRQVRAWGYAERDDDLLLRHGVMWRRMAVVPYGRLQFVDVRTGPVASALGIATVQLHTASAHSNAEIPGVPTAEAARLRDRLAARGEAQLAGL